MLVRYLKYVNRYFSYVAASAGDRVTSLQQRGYARDYQPDAHQNRKSARVDSERAQDDVQHAHDDSYETNFP